MKKNATGPLVSVVVPTYNHAHFLGRALQSVLNQTYQKWELIIVDNHSQDDTDNVVFSFSDPRIRLLKIHNNGVIAASRNMGMRASGGEWIAFLDSDDIWYPEKLETVLSGIRENGSIDVFSTDELMVDASTGKKKSLKFGPYTPHFYKRLLVTGNCLSPSASLVRRKFLNENNIFFREDEELVTAEDYDFWMLLARAGARFEFINSVQGEYLIHSNNSSRQSERHFRAVSNVLKDHVFRLQTFQSDKENLWRRIQARILLESVHRQIVSKDFSGISELIHAFRISFKHTLGCIFQKTFSHYW